MTEFTGYELGGYDEDDSLPHLHYNGYKPKIPHVPLMLHRDTFNDAITNIFQVQNGNIAVI
jgi:hypothetical protein